MIVYGSEDLTEKFRARCADDESLKKFKYDKYISNIQELEKCVNKDVEIIVLNPKDTEIVKFIYRHELTKVYLPVCSEIMAVTDSKADAFFEEKLKDCKDWKRYKEINRFKMLRAFFLHKKKLDCLPAHIQLEHTSFCNARCIMCGHALYGNKYAKHISAELIERVEKLLPTCELAVLHGYGEPLLTKGLSDILTLYKKYDIEVTMNTNLSYLPNNLLISLKDTVKHLRVSCDAVTKELYEKIRPGLKFADFVENVKKMRSEAPNIELMMETVIMRQNVEQIPEIVKFAYDMGFSQISLNRLGSHPALNNNADCLDNYPNLTSYFLKKGLNFAKEKNFRVFYPTEWILENENQEAVCAETEAVRKLPFKMPIDIGKIEGKSYIREFELLTEQDELLKSSGYSCSGVCESLMGRTNIDLDGNVFICCMNTLKNIGNLFEKDFGEIYNLSSVCKMREKFYNNSVPKFCASCSYVMNGALALADVRGMKNG